MAVINKARTIMTSLKSKDSSQMYKLKALKVMVNTQFLNHFHTLNVKPTKIIKLWYLDEWEFKENPNKLYPTNHFMYAFYFLIALLSQLNGEENATHLEVEWILSSRVHL